MKKTLLFILFILLFKTASFSQATFVNADSVVNYLAGNWRWLKSCGGLAGGCNTPTTNPPNNQSVLFTRVAGTPNAIAYTFYHNSAITQSGTTVPTYTSGSYGTIWSISIVYSGTVSMQLSIFTAKTDSVWLKESCSDCFLRSYVRDQNAVGLPTTGQAKGRVSLFPNPVGEELRLQGTEDWVENLEISNYDSQGRKANFPVQNGNCINVSSLPPGIYWLLLRDGNAAHKLAFVKE